MNNFLKLLKGSPLFRFALVFILFSTSAILANWYDWSYYILIGISTIVAIYTLVLVVFAWIINPIRRYKNKDRI
jgi:uncharacterized membrane protein YuzA (DUF378 family)